MPLGHISMVVLLEKRRPVLVKHRSWLVDDNEILTFCVDRTDGMMSEHINRFLRSGLYLTM